MSRTRYVTKIEGKKIISMEKLIKRHGGWFHHCTRCGNIRSDCFPGVLGLSAIVLSSPYDIAPFVPEALMFLCEHSDDPDLIQVS